MASEEGLIEDINSVVLLKISVTKLSKSTYGRGFLRHPAGVHLIMVGRVSLKIFPSQFPGLSRQSAPTNSSAVKSISGKSWHGAL